MTASVIHTYILAYHTSTDFPLPLILEIFSIRRNLRNPTKKIWLRKFAGTKVIHQLFILREQTLHQLSINAPVMFNPILLKVDALPASGQRNVPSFSLPMVS